MSPAVINDPILKRFRAALDELYGDRIERVVLFGSRARGDARADSDYDVAVFLQGFADRWQEVDRIIPVLTDILYEGRGIHSRHAVTRTRAVGSASMNSRSSAQEKSVLSRASVRF